MKLNRKQQEAVKSIEEFLATASDEVKQEWLTYIRKHQRDKKESRNLGRRLSRKARKPDNYCHCCRFKHWPILHVHHINPVSENGFADEQLMWTVCPNCHAYVHELRRLRGTSKYAEVFDLLVRLYDEPTVKNIEQLANFQSRLELLDEGQRREFTSQYTEEHAETYRRLREPYDDDLD